MLMFLMVSFGHAHKSNSYMHMANTAPDWTVHQLTYVQDKVLTTRLQSVPGESLFSHVFRELPNNVWV